MHKVIGPNSMPRTYTFIHPLQNYQLHNIDIDYLSRFYPHKPKHPRLLRLPCSVCADSNILIVLQLHFLLLVMRFHVAGVSLSLGLKPPNE